MKKLTVIILSACLISFSATSFAGWSGFGKVKGMRISGSVIYGALEGVTTGCGTGAFAIDTTLGTADKAFSILLTAQSAGISAAIITPNTAYDPTSSVCYAGNRLWTTGAQLGTPLPPSSADSASDQSANDPDEFAVDPEQELIRYRAGQ